MGSGVNEDRIKWNKRYLHGRKTTLYSTLTRFYHLAPKGRALDVACGTGEVSIYLAKKGFDVDAFDISDVAIRKARLRAKREALKVNFKTLDVDLLSFGLLRYDLIVNFYFLNRSIFPKIKRALRKGGILIFETYNEDHICVNPKFNPNYLLKKGELIQAFRDLKTLYYSEIYNITTLVAQKV